jgi:hypothetical protein
MVDENIIIVKIKAGLGNQMFQYAFGRALALRSGAILKLDLQEWKSGNKDIDPYGLDNFNIVENIASDEEIAQYRYPHGLLSRYIEKIRIKLRMFNVSYIPRMTQVRKNKYRDGYWQSEKYFADFSEQIQDDFTLKKTISSDHGRLMSDMIRSINNSTSVHIRKGKIAIEGMSHPFFGIVTEKYISEAIKYITNRVGSDVHLFIFSDNIDLVKSDRNIKSPITLVSDPSLSACEEIILMSLCKHNIIANSTFSWWGGWLNKNPDKIIVAPKMWSRKNDFVFKDLIPPRWVRI